MKNFFYSKLSILLLIFVISACSKDDDNGNDGQSTPSFSYTLEVDENIPASFGTSVDVSIEDIDADITIDDETLKSGFYYVQNDSLLISGSSIIGTDTTSMNLIVVTDGTIQTGSYQITNGLDLFGAPDPNFEATGIGVHTGIPDEILFFYFFGDYTSNSSITISEYDESAQIISGSFNFGLEAANSETGEIETLLEVKNGIFNKIPFVDYGG